MNNQPTFTLSVIIVNWNTRDLLRSCLSSIYATLAHLSFEVFLIDNASSDESADMVESEFPQVNLIRNRENLGFSAANNLGLRCASGQFVMLLNPDTELRPGAVDRMLSFAKEHPDVGLIGPKLVMPNGQLQPSGRPFPTFLREAMGITRLSRVFRPWHDEHLRCGRLSFDETAEVDEVSGACMFVRRSALDSVGLLDERFFMYYEDVDLCYRLKKAGWKVIYMGEAELVHAWAQGAIKAGVLKSNGMMYRSQYQYFLKHHGIIQAVPLRVLSLLLLWALRVKYAIIPPKVNGNGSVK